MRWALLWTSLLLNGCFLLTNEQPDLVIQSPSPGARVTDHEPVTLFVAIDDVDQLEDLRLIVDGIEQSDVVVSPTPSGQNCNPCELRVTWAALNVKEGLRVIGIQAINGGGRSPGAAVEMIFDDVPELAFVTPQDHEDLLGVGGVRVEVAVIERGVATIDLEIDGVPAAREISNECLSASGCSLVYDWDTSALAAGPHDLHITVTDNQGNVLEDTRTVELDDTIDLTSLQVTNIVDESGTLEIEVYLFDATTNQLLGCAGSAHGTGPVDTADTLYAIAARLVNPTGDTLRGSDLEGRSLRFEVWEDDDAPVCPTPPNPNGNDFVGASPGKTVAEWKATPQPIAFGNVTELGFSIGRPLRQ